MKAMSERIEEEIDPVGSEKDWSKSPQADDLGQAMQQLKDIDKNILEYHFLYGHSLRESYRLAGAEKDYTSTYGYRVKQGKFAGIFIEYLKGRQLVYREFGVDMPKAVELIKLRDQAKRVGDLGPSIRAHEMILKLMGDLGPAHRVSGTSDGGSSGNQGPGKDVDRSSRSEILTRLDEIQMAATGEHIDITEVNDISSDDELSEVVRENSLPARKKNTKNKELNDGSVL